MEVAIEHEKRARVREVDELQVQLRQREIELQKAQLNLGCDTDARRTAEAPKCRSSKQESRAGSTEYVHSRCSMSW